jgi:hypothetical protein
MSERVPDGPPSARPPEDPLISGKEIAAYLNRDVTTVQRRERREGIPDRTFVCFVQGSLPDALDIWRIRPAGGSAQRITSPNGRVTHPVLDSRTLLSLLDRPRP